ncbi:MAG: GNAT family N-acetyltransferase [Boseongicola sp.]|nr:MAG: GNAT family N-acetyltransferase [Boseongicola sp.]
MDRDRSFFSTRIATSDQDLRAAERLRYKVFIEELGGDGPLVDHESRFERDQFDPHYDHLILVDSRRDAEALDHVVGVYRLLDGETASKLGRFYSEDEYDIAPLRASGRRLLELGRSCLHADFRGGMAMYHLWNALSDYVNDHDIDVLFGVASFHGTDVDAVAPSLSLLHHKHLAPPELRAKAHAKVFQSMNLMPLDDIDRVAAMKAVPALIKAYLRLGGTVGDGAYVDREFNTIDVCLILDTEQLNERAADVYRNAR